ncbi:MAG: hypothetical protein ACXVB9_22610 [Bdellovibrionota bacterium]
MKQRLFWIPFALALAARAASAAPEPTATDTSMNTDYSEKGAANKQFPKNSSTLGNESASDQPGAALGEEPPTTGTGGQSGAAGSTGGSSGAGMGGR